MAVEDLTRTVQELKIVPEIRDLPEESLLWLAKNVDEVVYPGGEILIQEGVPLNSFVVLLEGSLQFRRESGRLHVSGGKELTCTLKLLHYS